MTGLTEDGIVASSTVALIGEAGPEAANRLNRVNDFHGFNSQQVTMNLSIHIDQVNASAEVDQVKEATLEGLARHFGGVAVELDRKQRRSQRDIALWSFEGGELAILQRWISLSRKANRQS